MRTGCRWTRCQPLLAGRQPRSQRAVHVLAGPLAGSREAMTQVMDHMSHAPGCQCHGCGVVAGPFKLDPKTGIRSTPRAFGTEATPSTDYAFEMAASSIRYGRGVTAEVGMDMENLGCKKVMVLTDCNMVKLPVMAKVLAALQRSGVPYALFDKVMVEPTNASFEEAIEFAQSNGCDGFVSVGGGSVMDTAKAASLFTTFPEYELLDFVNAPVGKGLPVPGKILPHIAIPTTAGTGSETTGQAIFDYEPLKAKTGIGNRALKPTLGIIDPENMETMPTEVAIASGFDVLCHSLESYTAIPYQMRSPRPENPNLRPAYQGSNPISDVWCRQALKMMAAYFVRAVEDPDDKVAKEQMCLAATYAGVGFGNAGVHLCHGMSYPVSGLNKQLEHVQWAHDGYTGDCTPKGKIIPHGISVVLPAPAVFRFTSVVNPERHLECAALLGADVSGKEATPEVAGGLLSEEILKLMERTHVPMGLAKMGFGHSDIGALVDGALPQQRVLKISPNPVAAEELGSIYEAAMAY